MRDQMVRQRVLLCDPRFPSDRSRVVVHRVLVLITPEQLRTLQISSLHKTTNTTFGRPRESTAENKFTYVLIYHASPYLYSHFKVQLRSHTDTVVQFLDEFSERFYLTYHIGSRFVLENDSHLPK